MQINHDYPKQIVVYRDGVGDGQMQYVLDHEVPQMKSAFQAVVPPIDPKFTMVVVQKRINTRFFRATVPYQVDFVWNAEDSLVYHSRLLFAAA